MLQTILQLLHIAGYLKDGMTWEGVSMLRHFHISDASYLVRYLRVAKWSQLEALKRLESYLSLFDIMPQMICDIDMTDPKIIAFLKTGYENVMYLI